MKLLTCFDRETGQWRQARARARFALLRAVLMWGRGALIFDRTGYKLSVQREKFDGIVDAVEIMLKHLLYDRAARMPEQAREFFSALSVLDDFSLAVRQRAVELKRPACRFLDGITCGAVVRKVGGECRLERASVGPPTLLDFANSIADNIAIAAEIE
jgi:hypothetical protein